MDDYTQNPSSKNFKFKELKVYSSTEWLDDNKKKYRQVFDSLTTSYIYAELSFYNKMFDRDVWDVEIELKCFEVKNSKKEICSLNFKKKISKYDHTIYVREGWGNKKEGSFWKKGTYYWEAWIDGEKIGIKYFYIEGNGSALKSDKDDPYFTLQSLKLYEGNYDDVVESERTYLTSFSSEDTRYVYAELSLRNNLFSENWQCELFVKFYNESRELKGQVVRLNTVKKDDETIKITAGWGANTKGSWKQGTYSLEVVFMDKLIALVYFEISDEFVEGDTIVNFVQNEPGALIQDYDLNTTFTQVFEKLDNLIGLKEIKSKVKDHAQYLEFLKLRKDKGFKELEKINIHSVFMGNPGTGKTTVAKMMGLLYKKMGLLTKGHVVEVDRVDLVGEYIGQTAPKVKEVIEKARGGVLFIDEAYSLARTNDDNKDFGREVIEILLKEMSNGKGDLSVIVAGYPKEMKHFVNSNPGLKSRFKHFFDFPDYMPTELIEIALHSANTKEVSFSKPAFDLLGEMITSAYRDRDRTFGNARFVNDLVEQAKIKMALRIMKKTRVQSLSKNDISEIQLIDMNAVLQSEQKILPELPIDEKLLESAINELNSLVGISNVKKQIHEMINVVRYYKQIGKNVLSYFSLHTVFIGNPGTGKTTVARILCKIYKALGILERGHMVETDRQGLVAGFVGQTAIKTREKIDEAHNGILFIDEAYALNDFSGAHGSFGNEAIQTLLKSMEDLRGQFFVFVAGYPENMESFLKANPGLSSRFDKTLKFEDYSASQLLEIGLNIVALEGYKINNKAKEMLQNYFIELSTSRDKYFGNARTVRKVILSLIQNQNLRMNNVDLANRRKTQITTIIEEDVRLTISNHTDESSSARSSIGFRRQEAGN